jgi:hypothetical protein
MIDDNITGRDPDIIVKALAYAISAIELFSGHLREEAWSYLEDMRRILETYDEDTREMALRDASRHLYQGLLDFTSVAAETAAKQAAEIAVETGVKEGANAVMGKLFGPGTRFPEA